MYGEDLDLPIPDGRFLGKDYLGNGADTGMRLHEGEDWDVMVDVRTDQNTVYYPRRVNHRGGFSVPAARLRRIGWLDQRGRVWLKVPPSAGFDGGSLTPLLIDARD